MGVSRIRRSPVAAVVALLVLAAVPAVGRAAEAWGATAGGSPRAIADPRAARPGSDPAGPQGGGGAPGLALWFAARGVDRQADEAGPGPAARRAEAPARHLLVHISRNVRITSRPGGGRVLGTMPAGSRYYRTPIVAWVLERTEDGRFGRVPVPYGGTRATGWIPLRGFRTSFTSVAVRVDLSAHRVIVLRRDAVLARFPATTGAPSSPTPPGRYFVTDRVPFPGGGPYGTFAFGISGIQTRLPAGWPGGDQLAIHGTNRPGSIGRSASAGCLRVSEAALARLRPLLRLGTPVVITV